MNLHLKAILTVGLISLNFHSAHAGEQRLVGYANGKPLYVSGGPIVRKAIPVRQPVAGRARVHAPVRAAARVNVGCTQSYHGPAAHYSNYAPNTGYGWGNGGYYDGSNGFYDSAVGYGLGHDRYNCNSGNHDLNRLYGIHMRASYNQIFGNGYCPRPVPCAPYVNPYPAAAAQGYSFIPRYGASTHAPQHP